MQSRKQHCRAYGDVAQHDLRRQALRHHGLLEVLDVLRRPPGPFVPEAEPVDVDAVVVAGTLRSRWRHVSRNAHGVWAGGLGGTEKGSERTLSQLTW